MIFVTVGTTDFDPLVVAMDRLAATREEPIVMQIGRGRARPVAAASWFSFAPSLDAHIRAASVVVSHGGLGTVVEVLRAGGRLVAVSNPDRYDRHQDDLLRAFEASGHLVWCRRLEDLPGAIGEARSTDFAPYAAPPCSLPDAVEALVRQPPGPTWWRQHLPVGLRRDV